MHQCNAVHFWPTGHRVHPIAPNAPHRLHPPLRKCNVSQFYAMFCNVLQYFAMFCNVLQYLQNFAAFCNISQCRGLNAAQIIICQCAKGRILIIKLVKYKIQRYKYQIQDKTGQMRKPNFLRHGVFFLSKYDGRQSDTF